MLILKENSKRLLLAKDEKTFYSSVSRQSKKLALKNGVRFALPSAMLLLLLMFFQKIFLVSLFLFLASVILVAVGFLPYKKITYLENHPLAVQFFPDKFVFKPNQNEVSIPFNTIEKFDFVENAEQYGIQVKTKDHQYFLPYFFKEDYLEMKSLMGKG